MEAAAAAAAAEMADATSIFSYVTHTQAAKKKKDVHISLWVSTPESAPQ